METVWVVITLCATGCGIITGKWDNVASSVMKSGEKAVTLLIMLTGTMIVWSGLLEILQENGDMNRMARMFRRLTKRMCPGLTDDGCWAAMGMNITANMLGLGNAATPSGIEAATRLAKQGRPGLQALGLLLVLNNTGLQVIPTTVMAMRQAAGAAEPAAVLIPTMVVSSISTAIGVMLYMLLQRGLNK